ncbi:hypothetical protein BC332_29397 [Capsicum chinense]|nr:hypothetical protein BC332_29397 [Capsicum chinense]
MRGVKRFGKKGKLIPHYIGPYKILSRAGKVAYKIELPSELSSVHLIFHVSILRKHISDAVVVDSSVSADIQENLSFDEIPIEILDFSVRRLRNKEVPLVKHIDVCFYYLWKKSKSLNDVYSMDSQNLKDGGQEHHLMEYINGFCMYAAVPWNTVEDIFIPINIKEKHHWILPVLLFLERCIFLYDSYESSGHYAAVLAEIEKIAKIIPLCLQACDFYVKKGIDHQSHPRYKDKESSDRDCGVFMVMYAECLSYDRKVIASEFNPNALRTRYVVLLWDYGIRKQEENVISDVKAPVKPARQSRITSVTEVVDV